MQGVGGAGPALQALKSTAAATCRDLLELHGALAEQNPGIRCACVGRYSLGCLKGFRDLCLRHA